MKKLLYFLAFAAAFSLWSCSDDDEGGDPDDPQYNLLSEARIEDAFVQFTYDAQGRLLTRRVNGQAAGTITYAANGASLTLNYNAQNIVVPLDALGNATEFMDREYTYYTGAKAGYIHTMTEEADFVVGASTDKVVVQDKVYTFTVDDDGKYTTITETIGANVTTYTVLYGSPLKPNKSESFNPLMEEYGITFLGKGPTSLPTRVNCSDDSYITYTYVLYPSGHVRQMTIRRYDDEGDLWDTEVFYGNWKSGGTNITGGVVVPGTVDARVTSVVEWADTENEQSTTITYNAQGDPATVVEQYFGEDPENLVITYPTATQIAINGTVVGTLNAAGNLTEIFDETYTYNASGYQTKWTREEEDGDVEEEVYTYNADNCVTTTFWREDYDGDDVWDDEETWEYEYEDEEGFMIRNVSNSVDVAKYQWWGTFFGKVSPYLPILETGPYDEWDLEYDLDVNWYPTTIYWFSNSGPGEDRVEIEWEELDD